LELIKELYYDARPNKSQDSMLSYNIAGLEDTTNQAPHGTRECMCSWEAPDDGHNGVRNL